MCVGRSIQQKKTQIGDKMHDAYRALNSGLFVGQGGLPHARTLSSGHYLRATHFYR